MRLIASLLLLLAMPVTALDSIPDNLFENLTLRHVGPPGNRVSAVVGSSLDANLYYLGAASGGVFRSRDGGHQWEPIFDDQPAASIGALALSGNDVWVGTGESFIRSNVSMGNGIYVSRDGGDSFQHVGLSNTGRIARIVIHPKDPKVVYVAALGHLYGPQEDRGIFRTRDGGITWDRVLFINEDTGASDLIMDPHNPLILYAATWEMTMNTWSRTSGGPGSGLHKTRDGGDSWEKLSGNGLPAEPWGRIGLSISPADAQKIYALIETNSNPDFAELDQFAGVLWRSADAGRSWSVMSSDNRLTQRPLYYSRALVAPDDADEIHFMATQHLKSTSGGGDLENVGSGYDHHDIWIDPANTRRMIVGHDGGVSISTDGGEHWHRPQLPIAQMYHVHTDDAIPYFLYGNRQDGPSTRGPSNTLTGGPIAIGNWRSVGGCEVGFAVPSKADPDTVWSGCYDGILERYSISKNLATDVSVWPEAAEGRAAEDLKYRFQWTFPLAVSPHDGSTVYAGSQYVHQTQDQGHSWSIISPDLTTNDPELQRRSGGLTLDDAGPTIAPTVFAIAESTVEPGVIWAGTNDGQLQVTRNGGESWRNVTQALGGLPALGTVSQIQPSFHDAATAYVAIDRHQMGDFKPYLYATTNFGRSWKKITKGIEDGLLSYAHTIIEHPRRAGLLFAGTEDGIYVSFNAGERWHRLRSNLPRVPVHWLTIQPRFNDLVVATYGRGFWILDDLAPLEQLDTDNVRASVTLFTPRNNWRFRGRESAFSQPADPAAGTNPTYGVAFRYLLPQPVDGSAELQITDENGDLVKTMADIPASAGLHEVTWNLRLESTLSPKLRTRPQGHPQLALPIEGWRSLRDGRPWAMLAPPGRYTATLTVGTYTETVEFEVLKDPHSAGSKQTITAQMKLLEPLATQINRSVEMINELEWMRRQLAELKQRIQDRPAFDLKEQMLQRINEVEAQCAAVEGRFFDLRMTDAGPDTLRWERRLYAKQLYLARRIQRSDEAPTQAQREVAELLANQLEEAATAYDNLLSGPAAQLNTWLQDNRVGPLGPRQEPR